MMIILLLIVDIEVHSFHIRPIQSKLYDVLFPNVFELMISCWPIYNSKRPFLLLEMDQF